MSTDFTLEYRGDYLLVTHPPGYEITPEGMRRFWAAIAVASRTYDCRRVLAEGEVVRRKLKTTDALHSGVQASESVMGLTMAVCFEGYEPDEMTEFFVNVAANRGARVRFFSDREQAMAWLGVREEATGSR